MTSFLSESWSPRRTHGIVSSSPNPKTWEPGKPAVCVPAQVQRQEGETHWCPRTGDRRPNSNGESRFALLPPFCSIRVLNRLDEARPHWWGRSFYSLLIQMLLSSRNTLTDTPRNNMLPALWASLSLVRLTPKSSHHTWSRWQPSQNEMVHMKALPPSRLSIQVMHWWEGNCSPSQCFCLPLLDGGLWNWTLIHPGFFLTPTGIQHKAWHAGVKRSKTLWSLPHFSQMSLPAFCL